MGRQIVTEEDVRQFRLKKSPGGTAGGAAASRGMAGGTAAAPAADRGEEDKEPHMDTYQERLLKYIPTEVVTLYIFLDGILRAAPANVPAPILRWVVFAVLLAGTWFYLRRIERVSKTQQLFISTAAFAIWVFSVGGPFAEFPWYSPLYGAVFLPLYTFAVPIFGANSRDAKA